MFSFAAAERALPHPRPLLLRKVLLSYYSCASWREIRASESNTGYGTSTGAQHVAVVAKAARQIRLRGRTFTAMVSFGSSMKGKLLEKCPKENQQSTAHLPGTCSSQACGNDSIPTHFAAIIIRTAMNRTERIPTLHELKLAGRVERARALFGPGGYLDPSVTTTRTRDNGLPASRAKSTPTAAVSDEPAQEVRVEKKETPKSDDHKIDKLRPKSAPEPFPSTGPANLGGKVEDSDVNHEGSSSPSGENLVVPDERPLQPAPLLPIRQRQGTNTGGGDGLLGGDPSLAAESTSLEDDRKSRSLGSKPSTRRSRRGGSTIVTLKIVGGRPGGRGFTNLEQSGKVFYDK